MKVISKYLNLLLITAASLSGAYSWGAVNVLVQDNDGKVELKYECTAGESISSFALDVSLSRGVILGVTNFFRGPCTLQKQGYGLFPSAFRDHIMVVSGTTAAWGIPEYTPLAAFSDDPQSTLPGLNSRGVTLEFGALWDPVNPTTRPSASGTLCSLVISEAAEVTVTANTKRGGVVSANTGSNVIASYSGASVDPSPAVTGIFLTNGIVTVSFRGGELETSSSLTANWNATGNWTGIFTNAVTNFPAEKYFRVRR